MDEEIEIIPSLVLNGEEKKISVLYILIKEINEIEQEKLVSSIKKTLYLNRAVLSKSPKGTFLALFNVDNQQGNHEIAAIKTALAVQSEIKNLKSLKIGFGVNSGRAIISPVEKNIMKYTCLGNLINVAKKLSACSENNVLFTQDIYSKISQNLKAEEMKDFFKEFNMKVFSLSGVVNREKYDNYVREFMTRMRI